MIDQLKKAAMNQAMKIMSNPKFGKLMSDPRVMNAISKGFEVHGQIRTHLEEHLRSLASSLNLVSKDEFSNLSTRLSQVQNNLEDLSRQLENFSKKRKSPARKKTSTKKATPQPEKKSDG